MRHRAWPREDETVRVPVAAVYPSESGSRGVTWTIALVSYRLSVWVLGTQVYASGTSTTTTFGGVVGL